MAAQYLVLPREKEDCFPLYFEDMMTGHHAAAYYCHLWSRMLAADIFSAYTEVMFCLYDTWIYEYIIIFRLEQTIQKLFRKFLENSRIFG